MLAFYRKVCLSLAKSTPDWPYILPEPPLWPLPLRRNPITTIAYKDGILASDSVATNSAIMQIITPKIVKFKNKHGKSVLAAGCGTFSLLQPFFKWAKEGGNLDEYPIGDIKEEEDSFKGILIQDLNKIIVFEGSLSNYYIVKPPYSMGTGFEFALGSMSAGATAKEAVQYACELDPYTGGEVVTFSLK